MASFILNLLPKDFICDPEVELRHHKITYGFNATNIAVLDHPTRYGWKTEKFTKPITFTNTMTLLGKTIAREDGTLCINDGININFVKTGGEVDVDALYKSINDSGSEPDVRRKLIEILDESLNGTLDRSLSRRNLVLPLLICCGYTLSKDGHRFAMSQKRCFMTTATFELVTNKCMIVLKVQSLVHHQSRMYLLLNYGTPHAQTLITWTICVSSGEATFTPNK